MKRYMTATVLLGLLAIAGCADRGDNAAQNADEKTPAAEPARDTAKAEDGRTAPADTAPADTAPAGEGAEGARATTGRRTSPPAAAPRRPAARSEEPRASAPASGATEPGSAPGASAGTASNATATRGSAQWREVTIPEGTALPLELETALSSETAQVETPVRARLKQAVIVNGVTALPAGATVTGEVTQVERAGKVKGRSSLAFTFSQVRAENMTTGIRTAPLSFVGEASRGEDATKIGAGAVGGAIVGGIVGGGEGAAKGAAIGGAAGTGVVLATRGKEVTLPNGADLAATLAAPLTIRVPAR